LEAPTDRKKLRTGYTTGACSQAGVRACLLSLLEGTPVRDVNIVLPIGKKASFHLKTSTVDTSGPPRAHASLIKDGGDDPDCTHGAEIITDIVLVPEPGIRFHRGAGVGWISKPGLGLAVGEPAINPVPRQSMEREFEALYPRIKSWSKDRFGWPDVGIDVTISIPNGEKLAKETLNGRLGILEGLSILGTKGIVVPFSTSAYRASISQAMDVAVARGIRTLVLTTGGQSEKFAQKILSSLPEEAFVQIGDFAGFSIREAGKRPIEKVVMAGLMGKFSKLATGVKQTHAAGSQVDFGFLSKLAKDAGAPEPLVEAIRNANTARHAGELAAEAGFPAFFQAICERILYHFLKIPSGPPSIGILLTDFQGKQIGYAETD
jgi:cobalt-precorrin-5B (C1)-methyltransferase